MTRFRSFRWWGCASSGQDILNFLDNAVILKWGDACRYTRKPISRLYKVNHKVRFLVLPLESLNMLNIQIPDMPPPTEDPSPPTPSSTQDSLESDDATLRKSLETYRNSVPYATETLEEMTAKLEFVVGRLLVCASAKSWDQMMGWSSVLESLSLFTRIIYA
jgi:hypothetical protein